jgi:hypothetical protein
MGHNRPDEVGGSRAQYNVISNAILPGLIGTPLTYNEQRFRAAIAQSNRVPSTNPTAQEAWDARASTVPLGVGWLQPEDVSPVAVFLASDAAALRYWRRIRRDRRRRRQDQLRAPFGHVSPRISPVPQRAAHPRAQEPHEHRQGHCKRVDAWLKLGKGQKIDHLIAQTRS